MYSDTEQCDPIPTKPEQVFIMSQSLYKSFSTMFNQRYWKSVWETYEKKRTDGTLGANKGAWLSSNICHFHEFLPFHIILLMRVACNY